VKVRSAVASGTCFTQTTIFTVLSRRSNGC
jgi:hypothetical protein